ncbi:uncharacterized protein [Dysidea avara]|uniref:uncharacterized protein isoform X2 n=1 Tax=Dysidea avara TaxID=196820 RepID=UPI00331B4E1C
MLKIHSRVGREHLHVLRWKSKERSWHHGMAQGNLPKLTCLRGKSSVVLSGSNIHYGKTPDKSLHLDLHRLVQSFNKSINKNVLGLLKQIPIKSIFKKFSSYADRFKLGWQEDSEKDSIEDVEEMKKEVRAERFEEHVKQDFDDEEFVEIVTLISCADKNYKVYTCRGGDGDNSSGEGILLYRGDNNESQEEEGMQLDTTSQQSTSTQATLNGTVIHKDRKDDNVESTIQVVEPVTEQGMGQSVEIVIVELQPVSCTSSADELIKPTFVPPNVWYLDVIKVTVPDSSILPFPPTLVGPGENFQECPRDTLAIGVLFDGHDEDDDVGSNSLFMSGPADANNEF